MRSINSCHVEVDWMAGGLNCSFQEVRNDLELCSECSMFDVRCRIRILCLRSVDVLSRKYILGIRSTCAGYIFDYWYFARGIPLAILA